MLSTGTPNPPVCACCPVCNGAGMVSRPPWVAGDQPQWTSGNTTDQHKCKACNGTGVVWRDAHEEAPHAR